MAIGIPEGGFEINYPSKFKKQMDKTLKDLQHIKSFRERLENVLNKLATNPFDQELNFHSLSDKAANLGGYIQYPYAFTVKKTNIIKFLDENFHPNLFL